MALLIPKKQKPKSLLGSAPIDPNTPPTDPNQFSTDINNPLSAGGLLKSKQDSGDFNSGGILSNLDPNMANQVNKNITGQLTGGGFTPYRAAANSGFARAAQNLRSTAAGEGVGNLGQGAAVQSQQGLENKLLSSAADNQLQTNVAEADFKQKGTENAMSLANMNEQANQFTKNLELQYTNLATDQQNLLTQIQSQEFMQGKQIASNEQIQKDKDYLAQQGIDLETARLQGYDVKDANGNVIKHVMGTLELTASQFGLEVSQWQSDQDWLKFNTAIMAGDYVGANKIASQTGIPTIDWTNIQEKEQLQNIGTAMSDIETQLEMLGDNADPALVKILAEQYGAQFAKKQALLGVPFSSDQMDGIVNGMVNNVITPEEYTPFENYLKTTVLDWWENGTGGMLATQFEGEAKRLYEQLDNPNLLPGEAEKIAEQLTPTIWAAYQQSSGQTVTDAQKKLLKDAGLLAGVEDETEQTFEEDLALFVDGTKQPGELKNAKDENSENNAIFKALEEKATPWSASGRWENKSGPGNNGYYFKTPISKGDYIIYNGTLHYVDSEPKLSNETGYDHQEVSIRDVNTGTVTSLRASN